ncbi:MAG: DUF3854 domain-containing protein, partial [Chloroflexota bacterium]|nr:DUF3854 domain-containing protein [Chloroflexota bacterium]
LGATQVVTTIDNNIENNSQVAQAETQLVADLTEAGLDVSRATWPDMYKGLDDALVAHVLPMIAPTTSPAAPTEIPCADLRTRYAELSELHSAVMALLGNAALNPAERIVAVMALKNMEVAERRDPDGAEHYIPTDRIAEQAGVSTSTAATAIKTLEQGLVVPGPDDAEPTPIHLFERKVKWMLGTINRATGEVRDVKQTFYSRPAGRLPTDLRVLATAAKVKPRAHGGKRIACPDHPDAGVVVKWSRHCAACDRLLDRGRRVEPVPEGVNGQDADLLVADHPNTTAANDSGVNQQDALLVQNTLPSEYVYRSPNLGSSHNDEPAWLAEAPPVEEEPVASATEAWLAGAALTPQPRLDLARIPLSAADHAADCAQLHAAHADLAGHLEPLARARGRSPVPKPGAEAGDDPWTWR